MFHLQYAASQHTNDIVALVYDAFHEKFVHMLPGHPFDALPLYIGYYQYGLVKHHQKVIIVVDQDKQVIGVLVLEGLGVPFFSFNPPRSIITTTIKRLGLKAFLRLVVGMLLIEGYPPSNRYLYINTIIVAKPYRGQGIGKKLLKLAELIALKRKLLGVCLYVDSHNTRAIKLYEHLNFQKEGGFGGKFVEQIIGVKKFLYMQKSFHKKK